MFDKPVNVSVARARPAGPHRILAGHVFASLAACLLLVVAAQAQGGAQAMNDIKCTIEKLKTSRGYDLRGVVWSEGGGSGSYRLFVKKEGPNGRSSTLQEGLFALEGDEKQLLGTISMNAVAGDAINATLVVTSGDDEICTAEL